MSVLTTIGPAELIYSPGGIGGIQIEHEILLSLEEGAVTGFIAVPVGPPIELYLDQGAITGFEFEFLLNPIELSLEEGAITGAIFNLYRESSSGLTAITNLTGII